MRIGIDCRLCNETGVGRYIRNLVKELQVLDRDNYYILFINSKGYNDLKSQISLRPELGARTNLKSTNWKVVKADVRWHSIDEQLRLPSILEKEKLDLVHFPYFSTPVFYQGKFVVTIHDLIPFHFATGLATTLPFPFYKAKRLGYKLVLRRAVKKASKIITVSNATKDEVVKHLKVDPDKVVVTYEGIDDTLKSIRQLADKNKKFFLYVGNAYPHKNLDRLLQAFNILISQYPNIALVLVGKEDYFYQRLQEQANQMGLSRQAVFYGPASDEELVSLYQNAQALIIPSLMEGFGLPALEAMANNCLVIASDIAALREICSEAAIYFNPYDVNDIVEKMNKIYINDVHHYSENKRTGIDRSKMFSWKKMAGETLKVYQEVAEGG